MSERERREGLTEREDIEVRLAKAMAHPVRVRILELLNEVPAAPTELVDRIGLPLSNISYHFRTLVELDCIEAIGTEQARGSIKTTFRSNTRLMFRELCFAGMDAGARSSITTATLRASVDRVTDALTAETYDRRDDLHLSLQTGLLTDEAFGELSMLCDALMDRFAEIVEECARDAAETETDNRFPATLAMTAFESPKTYEDQAQEFA